MTNNISQKLDENKTNLKAIFQETNDLQTKDFHIQGKNVLICFLDTMADMNKINQQITILQTDDQLDGLSTKAAMMQDVVNELLQGNTLIFYEDQAEADVILTVLENERSPDEPENERIVQGSHLGFVENLQMNIHFVRRRMHQEKLKMTYFTVGKNTNYQVAMVYMQNKVNEKTVRILQKRLKELQEESVTVIGDLVSYLLKDVYTPFPKKLYTERPDRVTSYLEEGKIAIMMDNSSSACIVPISFFAFFQSPDDYNGQIYDGNLFRLLRLGSFVGALIFPATYIAVISFHFEIIPFEMITLVKNSIETVPFPPFFEALVMIITIELIREAGIRLPSPIGQTIGIVGGIIIGEAVVTAGLVSNVVVIVIALTAIMSFTISSYEMGNTLRILSFPIMVSAAMFGFVGIVASGLIILFHLCKLETLESAYFYPMAPLNLKSIKNTLFRTPKNAQQDKKGG